MSASRASSSVHLAADPSAKAVSRFKIASFSSSPTLLDRAVKNTPEGIAFFAGDLRALGGEPVIGLDMVGSFAQLRGPLGLPKMRQMRETAMQVLNEHVKIAGIALPDLLVEELSGGQAQAVAIARAVHFRRDMLLLDEPTSALSVRETNKVLAIVRETAEAGRACVLVTHNIYHAFKVCDRFVVVSHGAVVKAVRKQETSLDELTELIMTH